MYQSVTSVRRVKDTGELLFGVQRSSELILFDPREQRVTRRVPLRDRSGNPQPVLSTRSSNVWVVDYDTVVRLDRRTWNVEQAALLQPAVSGSRMFAGDVWVPSEESLLLVPRPGTGDVVVVDPTHLSVIEEVALGRQPIVAAVVGDGIVVARDWKSGDLLTGAVARRSTRRRWRHRS
jgi:hypothetical protein